MGYQIDYFGRFNLNKELEYWLYSYLIDFAKTRHMKRDFPDEPCLGVEGEFHTAANEDFHDKTFESLIRAGKNPSAYLRDRYHIIDRNSPPSTQPGIWCQWIPTDDRKGITWNGNEKFYNGVEWLKYIINNFIRANGYVLNGTVQVRDYEQNEYESENAEIQVIDNEVTVHTR